MRERTKHKKDGALSLVVSPLLQLTFRGISPWKLLLDRSTEVYMVNIFTSSCCNPLLATVTLSSSKRALTGVPH
ncbi:hypothetical protein Leryth_005845 [Lithospermum erythrorhizon]|nr:hypothetical protein Leryth_005845 [Lithospermum erythrorhizon]